MNRTEQGTKQFKFAMNILPSSQSNSTKCHFSMEEATIDLTCRTQHQMSAGPTFSKGHSNWVCTRVAALLIPGNITFEKINQDMVLLRWTQKMGGG